MAAQLEFDWVLIDLEHGACTEPDLQAMLLAVEGTTCAPLVRVVSNDQDSIKRALDLGATGVMIPYVSTAEEANRAVAFTRYPPHGCRGVAGSTIATEFGLSTDEYHANIHERTMVIVQIETAEGVNNIEEIVAVDGVDVVFVGPLDLSYNLGCPKNFEHPDFIAALQKVLNACQSAGTAVGILSNEDNAKQRLEQGFTFLAVGSDAGAAKDGLQRLRDA
ncbi:MAG: 2-dehydro-3-deoxyglucarate aldolase [Planctomycetaceae bacterium]|nr:2-dehydro-3-deoxyglucarate aldolase [Planctomycetaceae bacterium]